MAAGARIGRLVWAPFGEQERIGCVVALHEASPRTSHAVRPLLRWASPDFAIDPSLIALADWIADYYLCPRGEALAAVSFIGFSDVRERPQRWVSLSAAWAERAAEKEQGEEIPEENLGRDVQATRNLDFLESIAELDVLRRAPSRKRIVECLASDPAREWPERELLAATSASREALRALCEAGITQVIERLPAWRASATGASAEAATAPPQTPLALVPAQQTAFDAVARAIAERHYAAFLLQGVTGSGKTEVYLQAIQRCFDAGRQAICLVPEIALTPQTLERFRARFGDRVALCHGGLQKSQKLRLARALQTGEVQVVIGPRSAVFSPVRDLGLLIVDEEHEPSYKQEETPRYHARDVGLVRARNARAAVILGSATPSLESLENVRAGKYTLLSLPERIENLPLPHVEVVDMGKELLEDRNPTLFSRRLDEAIRDRLARREQVLLFLNRRGFANFALCPACGHIPRCPHDDITLTYHCIKPREEKRTPAISASPRRAATANMSAASAVSAGPDAQEDLFAGLWMPADMSAAARSAAKSRSPGDSLSSDSSADDSFAANSRPPRRLGGLGPAYLSRSVREAPRDEQGRLQVLICHLCGHRVPLPPRCPQCGDPGISVVGQGTQRIEDEIAERYPGARLLRMDLDTMSRPGAYEEAWARVTGGEVDILLGTQMIAKGLHLERVTLVGVVLADIGLFVPDFRSSERTFQLLTQVAGRAGRSQLGGEVLIQTYAPGSKAVQCAVAHDVDAFAAEEIKRRRMLRFPPVAKLAAITLSGKDLGAVIDAAGRLSGILRRRRHQDEHRGCSVLGPMPAPYARLKEMWRQRILVRAQQGAAPLHRLLRASIEEYESQPRPGGLRLVVDIDPMDLL